MVEVRKLGLEGVYEITPKRFRDHRGFFSETYNASDLAAADVRLSSSCRTTIPCRSRAACCAAFTTSCRPSRRTSWCGCSRGAILDVAVDIRKSSPTFGRWLAVEVSAEKWNQILVPKGFAHGFVTLVENTEVIYKVTAPYSPAHERSIRFDDPALSIDWRVPADAVSLSDKDRAAPLLADAEVFD